MRPSEIIGGHIKIPRKKWIGTTPFEVILGMIGLIYQGTVIYVLRYRDMRDEGGYDVREVYEGGGYLQKRDRGDRDRFLNLGRFFSKIWELIEMLSGGCLDHP